MLERLISVEERFEGDQVVLRLATLADCTDRYVAWLADPEVNRYLETRWTEQSMESIRAFVSGQLASPDSYLFAILERETGRHVGNIKVGPINQRHLYADVGYFIGERTAWGRGLATDAIRVATRVAFTRLGLHRVEAGLYASNGASGRALEKAGYRLEGRLKGHLRLGEGYEDHVWYGLTREDWKGGAA
jgi:RimJ/RimL family protein N-acetyltransferase